MKKILDKANDLSELVLEQMTKYIALIVVSSFAGLIIYVLTHLQ